MEIYKEENYATYKDIFDLEDNYFDARSHEFNIVDGTDISEYKNLLIRKLLEYEKKYSES